MDGNWGGWRDWSGCSRSCNGGTQKRIRSCNNPPPTNGGAKCNGALVQQQSRSCNKQTCRGR